MLDTVLERDPADVEREPHRVLRCRACSVEVADPRDAAAPDGGPTRRTFFNPAGVVFDLWLLSAVRNAVVTGAPTDEFTWFPGRPWQFLHCGGCGRQLGWRWLGEGTFYGLVASEVRED